MTSRKENSGFTLVELLVSTAVLSILILLISQLFSSATATANASRRHLDADEAARMVFDRMSSDLGGIARRSDVNYIFCKQAGNDSMFFYSEAPAYLDPAANMSTSGSSSSMALVGYRINPGNSFYQYNKTPVIERLGENLTWAGAPDTTGTNPGGMVFLSNPVTALTTLAGNWSRTLGTPPYLAQGDEHYQVLSDLVFRMEFCFLLKSGAYTLSGTTATVTATGYSNAPSAIPTTVSQPYVTTNYFTGASSPDLAGNVYGFPPDLGAIVVTIAVLDRNSRNVIASGGLASLGAALADSLSGSTAQGNGSIQGPSQYVSTAQAWQSQLLTPGYGSSLSPAVPQVALSQVRVYERTFYLNSQ